jgi:pSer/pThr/pTyr-binding forkhead associated (FHA) protein
MESVNAEGQLRLVYISGVLRTFNLKEGEFIIGRGRSCPVRLSQKTVSKEHAAVRVGHGRVEIRDLGSENGTWINGVRVREAVLSDGDIVKVGPVDILVTMRVDKTVGTDAPPLGVSVRRGPSLWARIKGLFVADRGAAAPTEHGE